MLSYEDAVEPFIVEMLVGPLPVSNQTTWTPSEYPLTRKTGTRIRDLYALNLDRLLQDIGRSVADITSILLGGVATGQPNDTLVISSANPLGQTSDNRLVMWFNFKTTSSTGFDSGPLLPSGLSFQADVTDRDPNRWKVLAWVYNDIVYSNVDELRKACFAADFEILGVNFDGNWTSTDQQGPALPMEDLPAPVWTSPSKPRYLLDHEQRSVSWMGFSFFLGFSADTGLGLFDVRFRNSTVLYELSLQESLSHYAGNLARLERIVNIIDSLTKETIPPRPISLPWIPLARWALPVFLWSQVTIAPLEPPS